MISKVLIAVMTCAVVAAVSAYPQTSIVNNVIAKAQELSMELLGQIGNKVYFMNQTERAWAQGRCESVDGLAFGTLRNREDFAFVRSHIRNTSGLWVAARLRGTPLEIYEAYEWLDGSEVSNDINLVSTGQELCLWVSGDDHVYTENCYSGRRGVLCQFTFQ